MTKITILKKDFNVLRQALDIASYLEDGGNNIPLLNGLFEKLIKLYYKSSKRGCVNGDIELDIFLSNYEDQKYPIYLMVCTYGLEFSKDMVAYITKILIEKYTASLFMGVSMSVSNMKETINWLYDRSRSDKDTICFKSLDVLGILLEKTMNVSKREENQMEINKNISLGKNPELESELQKSKEALNGIAEKIQKISSHEKVAKNSIYGSRAFKLEKLKDEKKKIDELLYYLESPAKDENLFASEIIMDHIKDIFDNLFQHYGEKDFVIPPSFYKYRELFDIRYLINERYFDSRRWLIDVLLHLSEFYLHKICICGLPDEVKDYCENDVDSAVKLHHDSSSVIPNLTNDMVFDSGAKRENKANKGRCDLLPADALLRLSLHYERGAERYGDRNWESGLPIQSFIDSGMRHLLKYMEGYDDEDHLAAAAWNIVGAMWTEDNHDEETAPGLELRTKRGVNRKKWSYEEIINGRNEN